MTRIVSLLQEQITIDLVVKLVTWSESATMTKSIVDLLTKLVIKWTEQALLNAINMNRTSFVTRCRHESEDNNWFHWLSSSLNSEFAWMTLKVSLLQWHEKNKLYYAVSLNQKWVCFNDIWREEINLKRLMKWAWNAWWNELETLYVKKRAWNTLFQEEINLKRLMKWAWNAWWNELEMLE